jgi:hypothetical protein
MIIMWQYLVFVVAAVNLVGYAYYLKDTLWGDSKPNRVTWLLWSLNPLIAFGAEMAAGTGLATVPVFIAGIGPLLVLAASFASKKAYWRLALFDYVCGSISIVALFLWALTANPGAAIVFAIISDVFAVIPTLIKCWRYPETETGLFYVAGLFCALTSFAAIKVWVFSAYAFPAYLAIASAALTFSVYGKKLNFARKNRFVWR